MNTPDSPRRSRGRLILIAVAVLLVAGLGIGLGVGLTGSSGPHVVAAKPGKTATQNPNTMIFKDVSQAQADRAQRYVVRIHGVKGVTFYPKTHELDVFLSPTATTADRAEVKKQVSAKD